MTGHALSQVRLRYNRVRFLSRRICHHRPNGAGAESEVTCAALPLCYDKSETRIQRKIRPINNI